MTNRRRERKQTRVRNGFPKTIPIFFPLVSNSIQPLPSLQCSQNSITNKRTKKKNHFIHFHPIVFRNRVHATLSSTTSQSSLLFLFVPPIVNSPFVWNSCFVLMQDQRYTKIYIYILTHYIYTHVCIHIYTVCVCVYCEIGIIHSKRHATSLVHNYADNHNVPEGNWCAWRDLITYAILCTRIKQKGVGG